MKKAIVTGGAGFIGSHMTRYLVNKGVEVLVIDDLSSGTRSNLPTNVNFKQLSLHKCKVKELINIIKGYDYVFHMAAFIQIIPSIEDPLKYNHINVDGTLKLLMACRDAKIKKLIYSASSVAYGDTKYLPTPESNEFNPQSPYGLQKLIGEQYCRVFSEVYGLQTVCLRYFNVYGERMSNRIGGAYRLVIPIWEECTKNNKPLPIINDGYQSRDFIHAYDVATANWLAANNTEVIKGEAINIGSGDSITINELANIWGGKKEFIGNRLETRKMQADITKAKNILGWSPTIDLKQWIKNYTNTFI